MAIQHYVSRFLTRPWERRRDHMLACYDFDVDRIEWAKAKDVFAQADIHSPEIERRLNELVEDPLARLWHRIREEGVKEVTDWRELRAAHLLFMTQAPRFIDQGAAPGIVERELDDVLGRDEKHLDVLVHLNMDEFDLRVFSMPKDELLFYPQTGVLGFPILEDPKKKSPPSINAALAVPLHPQILLTMVPKTALATWLAVVPQMFQAQSVSINDDCRKVVIPAIVVEQVDHARLVECIKGLRASAKYMVQSMTMMKEALQKLAGLTRF